jgi:hypothetical protein
MRKTFFIVLSIAMFLLPINIFSKNGDNKAFVDPELTVETKEKLLLQVKRIKLVRNSSNYNQEIAFY